LSVAAVGRLGGGPPTTLDFQHYIPNTDSIQHYIPTRIQ
jgi:hypothetical protein